MNIVNRRPPGADRMRVCLDSGRLLDLEEGCCRYPVSGEGTETRYCGCPTLPRKSWCARCDRRVHTGRRASDTTLIAELLERGKRR